MFRQHSDLFLQQAAVLERVATCPTDPDSWRIDEEAPESVEQKLLKENVSLLAKKSFEGMLQVQKRVDWLERAVTRKGIKPRRQSSATNKNPPKAKRIPTSIGTAYFHFSNEHGPRIGASMGLKSHKVHAVRSELLRIWSTMNPQERLPYLEKAEKARNSEGSPGAKRKADESSAVDEALSDRHESDEDEKDDKQDNEQSSGDRNSDDDSEDEDEPALLFVRKPEKRSRVSEKDVDSEKEIE